MANFIGFNTIGQYKKFKLIDVALIKRDLINAFKLEEGTMPGRPDLGTMIWAYAFEPNDSETHTQFEAEVRRVIALDTRISLNEITVASTENTISAELNLTIFPDGDIEEFFIIFDEASKNVSIV